MTDFVADWEFRGLTYQVTSDDVLEQLSHGGMTIYNGFDPSADSLHFGHLVPLLALRRMQLAGNRPIVLAGGATGMIGDPSFKSAERVLMTHEALGANLNGVRPQLEQFLDFSAGDTQAVFVNNYDWTHTVDVLTFLRDVGKYFTVNTLIARDAIRERLENREQGISVTEFAYPLLQAFDFEHLYSNYNCTLQMGGSDQWGNMVSGVDLVRRKLGVSVNALSLPLIVKPDGTKFGKTEDGTVWLSAEKTSPFAFFQFLVRVEDAMIPELLRRVTFLSPKDIGDLEAAMAKEPQKREAQRVLAREVTALVHGADEAARAERAAELLYAEAITEADEKTLEVIVREAPSSERSIADFDQGLDLVDAFVNSGLESSKSSARTSLKGGGLYVNNRRVTDGDVIDKSALLCGKFVLLRKGKRDYHVLIVN